VRKIKLKSPLNADTCFLALLALVVEREYLGKNSVEFDPLLTEYRK
jgi:hypothetical protein